MGTKAIVAVETEDGGIMYAVRNYDGYIDALTPWGGGVGKTLVDITTYKDAFEHIVSSQYEDAMTDEYLYDVLCYMDVRGIEYLYTFGDSQKDNQEGEWLVFTRESRRSLCPAKSMLGRARSLSLGVALHEAARMGLYIGLLTEAIEEKR